MARSRRLNWYAGSVVLLTSFMHQAAAVEPPLLFESGFENGGLSGWTISRDNIPIVTSERSRAGRYSVKSVLDYQKSVQLERTEVRANTPNPVKGEDTWYGFSVFLASPYPADPIGDIVAQWHRVPDAGEPSENPPLSLKAKDGNWIVQSNFTGGDKTIGSHKGDVDGWTDWVFRVRWSPTGSGEYEVWKNGAKVVGPVRGANTFDDAVMPFFKMGIYKSLWMTKPPTPGILVRTLYHDEFRMAGADGSYDAVAPRSEGSKPRPPVELDIE